MEIELSELRSKHKDRVTLRKKQREEPIKTVNDYNESVKIENKLAKGYL